MAVSGTNNGQTFISSQWGTSSPITGSAPTDAADGQPLNGLAAITLVISAASGKTLSGAGTMQAYLYDNTLARWVRLPSADFTVDSTGVQDEAFAPVTVETPRPNGRILWVPVGVTFNSGAGGVVSTQLGQTQTQMHDQGKWGG